MRPHLMVTDPPYGVDYHPEWRNETGIDRAGRVQRVATGRVVKVLGARALGKVTNDDRADWREAWALFPGDVAYVWHGSIHVAEVQESLGSVGLVTRCHIIWVKDRAIISRGHYHWQHEPCWYAVRKGATAHWSGDRKQSSVWPITHMVSETGHSTQKPVEAMRRPMENNSQPGQAVYDPFLGAGPP